MTLPERITYGLSVVMLVAGSLALAITFSAPQVIRFLCD